jgi:hypothetical protein
MAQDLDAMAKEQMKRVERAVTATALSGLTGQLAAGERVDELFGGQVNGQQAVVALTDRRLLACYGPSQEPDSIDYGSITQVERGFTKVRVHGAGLQLTVKSAARKDALASSLNERRETVS